MPRPTDEERLAKVHAEALAQFDRIQSAVHDERLQCLQDRRFYSIPGAQWEDLKEQFENKPKFEVNKVHLAVLRINNEYRNNRITVDFTSKDGADNDAVADTCDGLYRADEQDSVADEAYDNAFEEGASGGFGAWRLRAVYEDEEDPENDYQRIRIEPIFDADSCVFFDLNAKRQDKSDAKYCFVLTSQTPESYTEEWGDDPTTWPKDIQQAQFDWSSPDLVYVAEYYKVEETRDEMVVFKSITDGTEEKHRKSEMDEDPDLVERLKITGWKEVRRKKFKSRVIHKYIMSGGGVLEDAGIIAGKRIPIVPFYGKRWVVDGVERCMGHVRLSKDPQRLKNMQLSKLGEISAYSSVEKPILTPEQVAGHTVMWAEDNVKNYPYLLINPITDQNGQSIPAPPVAYTKAPSIPPAMAALLQLTEADMQEILGNPQNGEQIVSNVSGKVVEMVQQRLDMQTFIYMSNMAKSMQCCGEIWFSMAQDLYVEKGRKMKTVGAQGETGTIELLQPKANAKTGAAVELDNDLANAKLKVNVEVGPSSRSRRDATVRSLMNQLAVTQDPETQMILQALILLNMEGEGLSDVREFWRMKLVKMGVLKPTDEEKKELEAALANQGKDPQALYLEAAADQATAEATQARVKTIETMASAELKKAQAAETMAGIEQKDRQQAIDLAGKVIQPHDALPFDPQKAAEQDVIPAAISIPEDRMLRAKGGAGVMGPDGLMHYYNTNEGDDGGDTNDGNGGDYGGGRGRQDPRDFGDTPAERNAYERSTRDLNAERASHFAGAGSVDPNAVAEGKAYGINAGPRTHSFSNFVQGFKATPGGLAGRMIGGGIRAAIGDPGSPAVNGGGWAGLGNSGQSPSGFEGDPNRTVRDATHDGLGTAVDSRQAFPAQATGMRQAPQAPAAADSVYRPRVPIELWSTLDPAKRAEVMAQFWSQF